MSDNQSKNIEITISIDDTVVPVETDKGLEWWVFDNDGELVDAYWYEAKVYPCVHIFSVAVVIVVVIVFALLLK